MYPTISEFLKSIGIDLPLPIQTFGFFVAMAFGVAAWLLTLEFKRKQNEGVFRPTVKKSIIGAPAAPADYIISGIIGFLIGFKVLYMILHYGEFVDNPQGTLLSLKGNLIGS